MILCSTAEQENAVGALLTEREYQDQKHGSLTDGGSHTLGEWILLIESELAEAKQALIKGGKGRDTVRHEVIQVGALCLSMLEQHGIIDPHEGRQI
jgi:hypothetical protein